MVKSTKSDSGRKQAPAKRSSNAPNKWPTGFTNPTTVPSFPCPNGCGHVFTRNHDKSHRKNHKQKCKMRPGKPESQRGKGTLICVITLVFLYLY